MKFYTAGQTYNRRHAKLLDTINAAFAWGCALAIVAVLATMGG